MKNFFFAAQNRSAAAILAALLLSAVSSYGVTGSFTNGGGDNEYTNPLNWSPTSVPNTANGDTALIANGSAVTYTPGGDLTLANGGTLEISNGSFTQVVGNNYIQLNGNGTLLVDGGTFNQGTDSANPFNITGTGNAFTISSGVANINSSFNLNVGLTFTQSGGTVNVTGAETDFNSTTNFLNGGILNTALITGVNGGNDVFNISGGMLNLTGAGFNGIYGGGATQYLNFTLGSSGVINFTSGSTTTTDVQNFLANSVIEFNNTPNSNPALFNIQQNGGTVSLSLVTAVPEPSSVAFLLTGLGAGAIGCYRKRRAA